jgi:hypothetical protein
MKLLTGVCRAAQIDKQQLTSGEWEVLDQWLWVDPKRGLVYFMGLRDGPLNSHLYVTSYRRPGSSINRLTKDGYSHSVFMNKATTLLYLRYSSNDLYQLFAHAGVFHVRNGLQQYSVDASLSSCGLGSNA